MGYVRNLSIRVPWHDRGWDGHVCNLPQANSSCLALKLIAERRRDTDEERLAGEAFEALAPNDVPPCLRASASFLSPHQYTFESVMAYSNWSRDHEHILSRPVHLPAWGALIIPYRWMLKESGFELAQQFDLDASQDHEPNEPEWLGRTSWIQGYTNQKALLDAFAAPLIDDESLVLFYATRTPLSDDPRRVLIGAALLHKKHTLAEYPYAANSNGKLKAMVWERAIQHSLRPQRGGVGFSSGFVMPYQSLLHELDGNSQIDIAELIAFVPEDARIQFSYGSEHVTHGAAAAALISARDSLERIAKVLSGPWEHYTSWINERLSKLWKLQGPAPGLGVVLSALHEGFNGTLFAMALANELRENADPWPIIDAILSGNRNAPTNSPRVTTMLARRWENLKSKEGGIGYLKLLARFELTADQATRAIAKKPAHILLNPYRLFEDDRTEYGPIAFETIDRGLFPGKEIMATHPLPTECSPKLSEYDNEFRLRGACIDILERSTEAGHTLLPVNEVSRRATKLTLAHAIPLDPTIIEMCRDDFAPLIAVSGTEEAMTVQLNRYGEIGKLLKAAVDDRLNKKPKQIQTDWRTLVNDKFGKMKPNDQDERRAREEKVTALEQLAGARIGTLIGPAGTGKTTVLELLIQRSEIVGRRVCLLAPTGKARVRLGMETMRHGNVQTVAQFLLGDRFDANTGRYFTNAKGTKAEITTCVVDESSMLTEDMLAAIVDALPPNCRLILVGDPYQLPPIGAGCPFVDIIEYLKNHHGGKGVGELKTPRRQQDSKGKTSSLARSDVQLAAVFSGRDLPPGEDEVVVNAIAGNDDDTIRYREWKSVSDLTGLIEKTLAEEFNCNAVELVDAFESSIGATRNERGYLNFEQRCSDATERWQILSVNRNAPGGSLFINRQLKDRLRIERLRTAIKSNSAPFFRDWMRFTKPRGPEQIVYGDKVICVRNHRRMPYAYDAAQRAQTEDKEFIANGEMGMVTGQKRYGRKNPQFTHVEFAGRNDRNFSFRRNDFSDDGQPYLELGYAITVHKAQGSEFGTVILVLPSHSQLVSREMLYTALTRQKQRIWILHQGPFERFLALRQYAFSDIAARLTNLLRQPNLCPTVAPPIVPMGRSATQRYFLQDKLIHRTIRGEMVSSKNELAIANILLGLERQGYLTYQVEPLLPFDDGRGRWADFLVHVNGENWYWEHCGRLDDESYRKRWERKLKLYQANGYGVYSDKTPDGRLIVTEDDSNSGLDSKSIEELARKVFTN